jgi:lipoprotein NlpD
VFRCKSELYFLVFLFLCVGLVACQSYEALAPVSDVNVRVVRGDKLHRVQPGETLYSIAWRYELDFRTLAKLNKLESPYEIHPGQDIVLSGKPQKIAPVSKIKKPKPKKKAREPKGQVKRWFRPAQGKIVGRFSYKNKGINIAGRYGESVKSAARGKVVYAGNGIPGYGYLVIIKHNDLYLTAYGYNSQLLVKEGQWVRSGQQIAKMGSTQSGQIMLHFEVRKAGKPVNPLQYV